MSETYCLKWKFCDIIPQYYQELKETKNFCDVTLSCEEGDAFEAHKIVLAASSPVLDKILLSSQHSNPFIYMKGVKSKDLSALLDFVYCGKAKIQESDLTNFILLAEELKIKGLAAEESKESSKTSDKKSIPDAEMDYSFSETDNFDAEEVNDVVKDNAGETNKVDKGTQDVDFQSKAVPNETNDKDENQGTFSMDKLAPLSHERIENITEQDILFIPSGAIVVDSVLPSPITLKTEETTCNEVQIYEQIESMLQRYGQYWRCTVCGKLHKMKQHIQRHIETNHREDGDYPCNLRNKTYRQKILLEKHLQRNRCFSRAV